MDSVTKDTTVIQNAGAKTMNREMQPLDSIAELDSSDPCRQVFTLFYHNRSSKNAEIKLVATDNFHQERELDISFQSEIETDTEL